MADDDDKMRLGKPDAIAGGSAASSQRFSRLVCRITRRFFGLPRGHKLLVVEAVAALAVARMALLFVPFRVLAASFGSIALPEEASAPAARASVAARDEIRAVGWAVTRAARYVPFRAVCLPQAIAAKFMLDRRSIASVMHFGVAKNEGGPLAAHAWLDADQIEVTGYPIGPEFVEVARFL